ncbi:dihydrolipoyl dehydrogenase 3 [Caedimonas varicaedens]|uniref:Dihydrolipoyl dehydrogenase n=1 Tax=Caedimonas varicaedens TaxID=1629334 RepID=A0A0K8MG23_9PROT|nr:dihydrolipoyl dehydrogenase 3 [Caedimonas varicaedens]
MEIQSFDVIVIGSGPAGYVASIKAAQLGMKVACIDKQADPGGTCLNVGCIPSKVLLNSSQKFHEAKTGFNTHGIYCDGLRFDLLQMMSRKDKIVSNLTQGIQYLFRKNNVIFIQGTATFLSPTSVAITKETGDSQTLTASKIVIATGSAPVVLPNVNIDEKVIVTSTGALSLERVPERMVIIGGGYIGLEIGSVWRRLGAQVTVVEYMDTIVPQMDREISAAFLRSLKALGIEFQLGTRVLGIHRQDEGATVIVQPALGGAEEKLVAGVVMLSMGRHPFSEGLGLDRVGIQVDERGVIQINQNFQTNISSIYAIGDVVRGPMLAHKGEEEGVAVAEILAGQKPHINYDAIPAIVYTHPEVATVGKTEEQLKATGVPYRVGKFPFTANSRARVNEETEGFVKILSHQQTDEVLGIHIIHADAGNMIAEAVIAMEYRASSEDIARICHAHPTVSEAMKEAAMATYSKAIHI